MKKKKATKNSRGHAGKTYRGFCFAQRGKEAPRLVVFHAPVGEILEFSEIDALGPKTNGPQRERKEAKIEAIEKFLAADKANTIPTAIILAFKNGRASFTPAASLGGKVGAGVLGIIGEGAAATIVDGQHRLLGMERFDKAIDVAVVGLLEADDVERAFQFLIVNNKSSRVPATHNKALLARMAGTKLADRLKGARVAFDSDGINDVDLINTDKESPFFHTVDWTTTPVSKRMVQASALQLSLDYIEGLRVPGLEDRDVRRSLFLAIWRVIKTAWPQLWVANSRLVSKVGVVCLTRFVIDMITTWADSDELDIEVTDLDQVEELTARIIGKMNIRFWTTPWAEKAQGGYDTSQGRERIVAAITQLYRNGRSEAEWYTDIDIIERSAAS